MPEKNALEQEINLGDIDIDTEPLEDLSKQDLISLVNQLAGHDDSPFASASKVPSSPSKSNSSITETITTESMREHPDSSEENSSSNSYYPHQPHKQSENTSINENDGYQKPSELNPTADTSVLVECGAQDERKAAARRDLLGVPKYADRNVLLIQYRAIQTDEIQELATDSQNIKIITIGCTQSVPQSLNDMIEIIKIDDSTDVTRLGILAAGILGDWVSLNGQTVVSLDSLDVMLQQKTGEAAFRFLHILLGKLSSRDAISHFFVNPSSIDTQTVNTIKPLFDDVLTIDSDGVNIE